MLHAKTENDLSFCRSVQVMTEPPKTQPNAYHNYSLEANKMTNDVQRDQSAPTLQLKKTVGVQPLPTTAASPPTEPSFISFTVTKMPGTETSLKCRRNAI